MTIAGYNPRRFMTSHRTRLSALIALGLTLCLPAAAQWAEPIGQLAREIAAINGPGTVTLTAQNMSSLTADNIPLIKRDLQNELRAAGVRVVAANAAADIKLTLSENAQGYLWVAEVRQGSETRVAMVTATRSQNAATLQTSSLVTIHKTLLWSQDARILDLALVQAGRDAHMVVLDPENVSLFKMAGGGWIAEQQFTIPHTHAWPREVRGRLMLARDHLFDAYLPGVFCASTTTPPLTLNCRDAENPWPLTATQAAPLSASRNFFTGTLTPAIGKLASTPAFYSAAAIPRPLYTLWIFARTDGSVHMMDGVNDVGARARDWGSDIAAVKSSCGAQTQLLVTGTGDAETPDVMRAFEIADREPVEVAPAVDFGGPVTALWTASDERSATAVVKNLKTGKYDAFELSISCGQ